MSKVYRTTSRELFHGHHPECAYTVEGDPKACGCEVRLTATSPASEDVEAAREALMSWFVDDTHGRSLTSHLDDLEAAIRAEYEGSPASGDEPNWRADKTGVCPCGGQCHHGDRIEWCSESCREAAHRTPPASETVERIAADAIGLFLEYRDKHGYEEHQARVAAVAEVIEGAALVSATQPASETVEAAIRAEFSGSLAALREGERMSGPEFTPGGTWHMKADPPTTATGRALVERMVPPFPIIEDAILAIEAEARSAALDVNRDTLYRRIHALPGLTHHGKGEQCFPITDAVLDALREGK